ncbi:MAG: tRNA (adenosine(37)-N6)-dimethylallyltransferase MiaA [Dehalococcoidia bacterium]|nr:tRNA (adenosine(37)-N6)-dimethylallyltransferase MiaA [Dehalococcoidia bacterium]
MGARAATRQCHASLLPPARTCCMRGRGHIPRTSAATPQERELGTALEAMTGENNLMGQGQERPRPPLLALVGPTGTGKSAMAVRLAERFGGEIVGADSRQVYRGMAIGTGRPPAEEMARVPHHVIGVMEPDAEFSVAQYQRMAMGAIAEIHGRGRLPMLVGGSGQYVRAVLQGLRVPAVPPNEAMRRSLETAAREEGGRERLLAQLREVDPVTAQRIDPYNVRRVIRAIEVSVATGRPFSEAGGAAPPPFRTLVLGLTLERAALYRRIDARVDEMIAVGWLEEARSLLARGLRPELPALSSLGYREMMAVAQGAMTTAEAAARIKRDTHRFARGQYGWFRLGDGGIRWIDITEDGYGQAEEAAAGWLEDGGEG